MKLCDNWKRLAHCIASLHVPRQRIFLECIIHNCTIVVALDVKNVVMILNTCLSSPTLAVASFS